MAKAKINKITCCYGHPCFISIDNIDGKDVLKLDFNIKTYKILKQGWKELPFPENIVINDKLYLDEKMKDQLINALDVFIKTTYLSTIYPKTERGFSYNEWTDVKGNKIHIQDSSAATDAYIWFGGVVEDVFIQTENGLEKYKFPEGDLLIEDRMHLNISKVKKLKEIIQKQWIMNEVKNLDLALPVNSKSKKTNKI
jgi:hypothetical protein